MYDQSLSVRIKSGSKRASFRRNAVSGVASILSRRNFLLPTLLISVAEAASITCPTLNLLPSSGMYQIQPASLATIKMLPAFLGLSPGSKSKYGLPALKISVHRDISE